MTKKFIKILDFDIENRPLSYWTPDRPTAEITAIASAFVGDDKSMQVRLLGNNTSLEILTSFVDRYDEADMVTGHYIRRHDLPIINGALMEFGLKKLKPKLTCDTRLDMFKKGDIPATQEYLSELLGCPYPKVHMTQNDWRESNRLTESGLGLTKSRVMGDVLQHMWLRKKMVELGLLSSPKIWKP